MANAELLDYAGLKDAVTRTLKRPDLNEVLGMFFEQARAKFNRELRLRDNQVHIDGTATDGFVPLPDDYLAAYELTLTSGPPGPALEFVNGERAKELRSAGSTGQTRWYTIFGQNIEMVPAPTSADYRLRYYSKIYPMTNDSDNNWLVLKSPDLWIASVCLEAAMYLKDEAAAQRWAVMRDRIISDMKREDRASRFPAGGVKARFKTFG